MPKIEDAYEVVDEIPVREYKMPPEDSWDGVIYAVEYHFNIPPYIPPGATVAPKKEKGTQTQLRIQLEPGAGLVEYDDGTKKRLSVTAYIGSKLPMEEALARTGATKPSELLRKPIRVSIKHQPRKNGQGKYAKVIGFFSPRDTKLKIEGIEEDQIKCFKVNREILEQAKEEESNGNNSDVPF